MAAPKRQRRSQALDLDSAFNILNVVVTPGA